MFEKAAGYRLPKFGPKLVPPEIAIVRNPSLKDSSTTQEIISKVIPQTVMIQSGKQRGTGFLIDGKEINKFFSGREVKEKCNRLILLLCAIVFIFASKGYSILYLILFAEKLLILLKRHLIASACLSLIHI